MVNLELVNFRVPTLEEILSFIRYAAKLKKIKIITFERMPNNGEDGLDLAAWNKQRLELSGARKVTVYVPEYVYLATKWATNKAEYSLIKLKRSDSYDWENECFFEVIIHK